MRLLAGVVCDIYPLVSGVCSILGRWADVAIVSSIPFDTAFEDRIIKRMRLIKP